MTLTFGILAALLFIFYMISLNSTKKLKIEKQKLISENESLRKKLDDVVKSSNKLAIEYLNIKDMWTKMEKYTSQLIQKYGMDMMNQTPFGGGLNDIMEDTNREPVYSVDEILAEINEKGISNVDKKKIDFLKGDNIK